MNGKLSCSFPRRARVRATAQYQAVFTAGQRFSTPCFRLHVLVQAADSPARLGIAVSKRVDKHAHGRNRIKRQVREFFRLHNAAMPGADLVFVAKPEAAMASNEKLRGELDRLLQHSNALPRAQAVGTMPALEASGDGRLPTPPELS